MHIKKKYLPIEKIEEVKIYDLNKETIFHDSPKVIEVEPSEFETVLTHISSDVNRYIPINNGEDLIITGFGRTLKQRLNITSEEVLGRRFSECLPFYHNLFHHYIEKVVNKKSKVEKLRLLYFEENKLTLILTVVITLEKNGLLYMINNYEAQLINNENTSSGKESDQLYLMEYISQTGSYYRTNNKYTWTNGIYSIINRHKRSTDKYYNIIFDLALKEDKIKIEKKIHKNIHKNRKIKEKIKIKTENGKIKTLECNLYPQYDNNNKYVGIYGFFKDISSDSDICNPIDYILNGFSQNQKLALLIEPFSKKYSFTKSFYNIIGRKKEDYIHNHNIYKHIGEKEVVEKLKKMESGEIDKFDETFTFYKNKTTQKTVPCKLILESFYLYNKRHTIGFLIDITEDMEKREQIQLIEKQKIIIKEVHHRIKNNFQILNSFMNLEKREYSENPELIIEHLQSRINSLSILHTQTYESLDFENLNASDTIEKQDESLKNLLISHKDLTYITHIDSKIWLPISIVTPLLLIINELTINSVKHAFDNNIKNKQIYKHMKLINENTCEFVFKDNGVGLKNDERKHLGLTIIKSLIKQINGTLEITVDYGTQFKITFPLNQEYVGYK